MKKHNPKQELQDRFSDRVPPAKPKTVKQIKPVINVGAFGYPTDIPSAKQVFDKLARGPSEIKDFTPKQHQQEVIDHIRDVVKKNLQESNFLDAVAVAAESEQRDMPKEIVGRGDLLNKIVGEPLFDNDTVYRLSLIDGIATQEIVEGEQ